MGCTLTTDEVANIDRTIAALKSENDGYAGQLTRLAYEAELLRRDNAKLRELVRHLRECTRHNVCVLCDYADDACDFDYDMRELGVEP